MTMFDVSLYLALLLGLMGCLRSNDYNTTNYYFFKSKSFINISQRKQEKEKKTKQNTLVQKKKSISKPLVDHFGVCENFGKLKV